MRRFENKVAVVTGAAQGIGAAIALRFAQEGARVAILDRQDPTPVVQTCQDVGASADVAVKSSIEAAVSEMIPL